MAAGDLTTLENVKQWLGITGLAIASISQASAAVVTLQARPSTPLLNGGTYTIEGAAGMTDANAEWTITVIDATSFSIPLDSTALPAYTGGGVMAIADPLLARLITAASTAVQSWLNRTIASANYTETRDGQNMQRMMFKNWPVTAVASLSIDGQSVEARPALSPTNAASGFVFNATQIMVSGYRFTRGFQNVTINYTAGYATVPADVEQATIDIIGDWFKYRDRIGVASMGIEGQSISLTQFVNTKMPARALGILEQYRNVAPIA